MQADRLCTCVTCRLLLHGRTESWIDDKNEYLDEIKQDLRGDGNMTIYEDHALLWRSIMHHALQRHTSRERRNAVSCLGAPSTTFMCRHDFPRLHGCLPPASLPWHAALYHRVPLVAHVLPHACDPTFSTAMRFEESSFSLAKVYSTPKAPCNAN